MPFYQYVIFGAILLFAKFFIWRAYGDCKCRAERMPFLSRHHDVEISMWVEPLIWISIIFINMVIYHYPARYQIVAVIFLVWSATRIYYHRKRNKKRTLSKILGRIRINVHGRLHVTPN